MTRTTTHRKAPTPRHEDVRHRRVRHCDGRRRALRVARGEAHAAALWGGDGFRTVAAPLWRCRTRPIRAPRRRRVARVGSPLRWWRARGPRAPRGDVFRGDSGAATAARALRWWRARPTRAPRRRGCAPPPRRARRGGVLRGVFSSSFTSMRAAERSEAASFIQNMQHSRC
jgi:hypothetical protein